MAWPRARWTAAFESPGFSRTVFMSLSRDMKSGLVRSNHYILCVLMGSYTNSSGAAVSRLFVVVSRALLDPRYDPVRNAGNARVIRTPSFKDVLRGVRNGARRARPK